MKQLHNSLDTPLTQALLKVIIHKLRGEVSLVVQDTIDYVSTAYFEPKNLFLYIKEILCDFLVRTKVGD